MDPREIVYAAALAAVIVPAVAWLARRVGRWFIGALGRSVGDQIREVMKPDLDLVQHSINAMKDANTRDHNAVQARLAALEQRQVEVETRLSAVEVAVNAPKET